MPKFIFHMGVTLRSYGTVEIEADSIEAALPLLTADFVGENIDITETTTDSGQDLAVIDVMDPDTGEDLAAYDGLPLPSPYDPPNAPASAIAALKIAEEFMRGFEGDEMQEGIDARLATIRAAIANAGNPSPLEAAAPDMLATCRTALDFIQEEAENRSEAGSEYSDYEREPRELAEQLEAVIAAAEGRANG